MTELNHNGLEFMLMNSYIKRLPMYVRGGIGIGKSQTVRTFAQRVAAKDGLEFVAWNEISKEKKMEVVANPEKYFCFVDQRALMLDLGDFKLPKFDDNGSFEWCIPMVYAYLCNALAKGILFLDEFNLAPPSIQGMFYSIVNDRQIGEAHLGDGVYVVAAGNNIDDKAAVYDMPYPLRNRFMHVFLANPMAEDWVKWGVDHDVDPRVLSFLRFRPALMYAPTFNGEFAFPTPRSWDKCSKGIRGLTNYDQIRMVAEASVGEGAAIELVGHIKLSDKIDLDDLLENPDKVTNISEAQLLFSVAAGMVEKYRTDNKRLGKILKLGELMRTEYTIWMIKMIRGIAGENKFRKQVTAATSLPEFAAKYGKYLVD